jgi:hypothetical protein
MDMDFGVQAATVCAAISLLKAQASQGNIASISEVSTVPPHQMRNPAGASR